MGILDNIKKGAKSYSDNYKKTSADNKKYRSEVNEAVKVARRKSYKSEAVKQAGLKGKIMAKQKFNPTPQTSGGAGGMTAEARSLIYGSGFGQPQQTQATQRVVKQIQKTRASPKKKKKRSKQKTRVVYRTVQAPKSKPVDAVADILARLPQ